jgi:hypothetical protein
VMSWSAALTSPFLTFKDVTFLLTSLLPWISLWHYGFGYNTYPHENTFFLVILSFFLPLTFLDFYPMKTLNCLLKGDGIAHSAWL